MMGLLTYPTDFMLILNQMQHSVLRPSYVSFFTSRDTAKTFVSKRPSTRVRIRVRFPLRFHTQFASKPDRDLNLHLTPITMVCLHISANKTKITCGIPLASNRTPNRPNRTPIGTRNRTCRRPLRRI
jgi:hypothetical protein